MPVIYNLQTGESTEYDGPEIAALELTPELVKATRQMEYPPIYELVEAIHAKEKGDNSLMTAWVAAVDQVNADNPLPE